MTILSAGPSSGPTATSTGIDEGEASGHSGHIIFLHENAPASTNEWSLSLLEFTVDSKFKIVLLNCTWILNMRHEQISPPRTKEIKKSQHGVATIIPSFQMFKKAIPWRSYWHLEVKCVRIPSHLGGVCFLYCEGNIMWLYFENIYDLHTKSISGYESSSGAELIAPYFE